MFFKEGCLLAVRRLSAGGRLHDVKGDRGVGDAWIFSQRNALSSIGSCKKANDFAFDQGSLHVHCIRPADLAALSMQVGNQETVFPEEQAVLGSADSPLYGAASYPTSQPFRDTVESMIAGIVLAGTISPCTGIAAPQYLARRQWPGTRNALEAPSKSCCGQSSSMLRESHRSRRTRKHKKVCSSQSQHSSLWEKSCSHRCLVSERGALEVV